MPLDDEVHQNQESADQSGVLEGVRGMEAYAGPAVDSMRHKVHTSVAADLNWPKRP